MNADRSYYERISEIIDRTSSTIPGSRRNDKGERRGLHWKRILFITVFCLSVLSGILFVGDYVALRYRPAKWGGQFGSMQVQRYYSMPQKNGKTEIVPLDPETQTCVHSLFPPESIT